MLDSVIRPHKAPVCVLQLSFSASLACLAGALVFMTACSNFGATQPTSEVRRPGSNPNTTKTISGTDEELFVGDSPETHYHPNVIMKRGEAYFDRQEYPEALNEYNRFLDLYRSHMLAPYAAFRIGEVHFQMARVQGGNFFGDALFTFVPRLLGRSENPYDRDPEPMQKAIAAFERMRKEYPGSRYDTQAQQKLDECHDWLAQTHLFVGQFYYRRGSYLAAAHRFEQIMKRYPDKPVAPDALYFLAKAYHELGADDWARDNLVFLVQQYPDSEASDKGKSLLAKLEGKGLFAKLRGAEPSTLLAQKSNSIPFSDIGPTPGQNAKSNPSGQPLHSSTPQLGSLGASSAAPLGQAFTACRLGVWC